MERRTLAASASWILAMGIVVAAIFGPLVTGIIEFRLPDSLVNQYLGGEVATLFVAAPMLVIAGVLWQRGDRVAPVLAFGPALYTVYTFVTAILGQEYDRYDGNAERAFPLYAALIAGGLAVAAIASVEIARRPAPVSGNKLRRITAGMFLAVAAFFAVSWTSQIAMVYSGDLTEEYVAGPALFWLIKLMDLAFLLPAFMMLGFGLLQKNPLATRLAYGATGYALCMSSAVLGMAVAMWLKDDPAASVAMIGFLLPVTAGFAALMTRFVALYRHGQPSADRSLMDDIAPLGHGHARQITSRRLTP
jgi:hypothetical protein